SARVITDERSCPELSADGQGLRMDVRAGPGPLFANRKDLPDATFRVLVCEALVSRYRTLLLHGKPLPLPRADIRRIVIFGDTGCRIKKKKTQDCNDRDAWPYAKIVASAAAAQPDLVIHLGDYIYREKPCSRHAVGCPHSPTGYGWNVWDLDFFRPSTPLFAAAPWIMVRGNHESCSRAGEGWFRFLEGQQFSRAPGGATEAAPLSQCLETSSSFVVTLRDLGFVVMDSAAVADATDAEEDDVEANDAHAGLINTLSEKYDEIASAIPPNSWLLTHAPFNAVRVDKRTKENVADNTLQQNAIGHMLSPSIKMIVSGHIHLFEAISFANGPPAQLVVGTGGDRLAKKKPHEPTDISGARVTGSVIAKDFGYMVWDRDGEKWKGELFSDDGRPMVGCWLVERQLDCREGTNRSKRDRRG